MARRGGGASTTSCSASAPARSSAPVGLRLQSDEAVDRRRAGVAARGRRRRLEQPGLDDDDDPGDRHRRPDERLAAINASPTSASGCVAASKGRSRPTSLRSACLAAVGPRLDVRPLRLANALPPVANVAVSNVPGPQFPLYVAGALMTTYFPVSILGHGVGLNITVQSYNGSLDFGPDRMPACGARHRGAGGLRRRRARRLLALVAETVTPAIAAASVEEQPLPTPRKPAAGRGQGARDERRGVARATAATRAPTASKKGTKRTTDATATKRTTEATATKRTSGANATKRTSEATARKSTAKVRRRPRTSSRASA